MISHKFKNIKLRNSFHKIEKYKKTNRFLFTHLLNKKEFFLDKKKLLFFFSRFFFTKKYSSKIKITNRCILNNRSRGVLRPLGISRMILKDLMQFGVIPGFSKAVW